MALLDNGSDYQVLENAARHIKGIEGLTCEVGLREGGGTKHIIDALISNDDLDRVHIAIDPYGSIPYIQSEAQTRNDGGRGPYPNEMMKYTLSSLYDYVAGEHVEVLFFPLEDVEFFRRFRDGVPVYRNGKKNIINQYALAYLDGPHNLNMTMNEAQWFSERSVPGSIIVFDDVVNYYDHSKVKEWMLNHDWQELEVAPSKISYIKNRA